MLRLAAAELPLPPMPPCALPRVFPWAACHLPPDLQLHLQDQNPGLYT